MNTIKKEKYKVEIVKGLYEGMVGYTYEKEPNECGIIVVYSNKIPPHAIFKPFNEIKFI
jgi:hypothetical protein